MFISRIAVLSLVLFAPAKVTASERNRLTLTGSSTVAPLLTEIAKKYESKHAGVRIDVQSGGSGRGISDTRQGIADIGMVSRALKPDEGDLTAHTVAMDGITLIVHKDNPVRELTSEQIVAIYTGKTTSWKDLGGKDQAIVVVNKAEGRSTLELFVSYFKLPSTDIKASVIIGDNAQGIKTVVGNPQAIGYVSIGSAEFEVAQGAPLRLLSLGGVEPNSTNLASGKFPLSRPLNLVTRGGAQGLARDFIKFATSAEVTPIIKEQFFVPNTKTSG